MSTRPAYVQPRVNLAKSMKRSAARRQCPKCGRKGALRFDAETRTTYCRWAAMEPKRFQHLDGTYEWIRYCTFEPQPLRAPEPADPQLTADSGNAQSDGTGGA